MKTLAIVQARTASTRLPGKVLETIHHLTMVERVLHRAAHVVGYDHVALAVPHSDVDLGSYWDNTVWGSNGDVLSRFVGVANCFPEYNAFVRFTADCPLLDVGVSRSAVDVFERRQAEIVSTSPDMDGLDTEVFTRHALMEAYDHATGTEREHVTLWMKRHLPYHEITMPRLGPIRWSVDDAGGLEFVRRVVGACLDCALGVPHHTNAGASIGGGDRSLVIDLHTGTGGGLVECTAADILRERMGDAWRYSL